ncbi:Hypothetical protein FKW44_014867 [Caligus rogercresseyi]|uniref:Uncharacterized protein n=1 Tax=Caligus rogercresseyi TaxID=217165 RepID=A0A7T8JZ86_CALRO|nr:Hypothetical protein FKW44_014867 [Caligus rogercresseyi]
MSHEKKNRERIADQSGQKRDRGDCWLLSGYILQCFKGSKRWKLYCRTSSSGGANKKRTEDFMERSRRR